MQDGALDDVASAIASAVELNKGVPRMSDAALAEHAQTVASLDEKRRMRVAEELTALVRRLVETGQDAWDEAIVQLSALVAVAIGGIGGAQQTLGEAIGAQKAAALIGSAKSLKPVGTDKGAGQSPLSARLKAKESKKRSTKERSR